MACVLGLVDLCELVFCVAVFFLVVLALLDLLVLLGFFRRVLVAFCSRCVRLRSIWSSLLASSRRLLDIPIPLFCSYCYQPLESIADIILWRVV